MKQIPSAVLSVFLAAQLTVGQESAVISVSKKRIAQHVFVLASDSLEGRKFGQAGHQKAVDYIVGEFTRLGLKAANGGRDYIQPIPVRRVVTGSTILYASGKKHKNKEGISFASRSPVNDSLVLPVKFIGWREEYPASVGKDTALHIFARNPADGMRRIESLSQTTGGQFYLLTLGKNDRKNKQLIAQEFGAANDNYPSGVFNMGTSSGKWLGDYLPRSTPNLRVLVTKQSQLRSIYGNNLGEYLEEVARKGKMDKEFSFTPMVKVGLSISYTGIDSLAFDRNVCGFLEGTDLKDEFIVLCAHYDHLGRQGDKIFHGADDNASGVAALLELARTLGEAQRNGLILRRSVAFIAFGAEETGLNGSHYYVSNPVFPIEKTVMLLNFDMVGRPNWANSSMNHVYAFAYNARRQSYKRNLNAIAGQISGFEIFWGAELKDKLMYRFGSDHHPFVKRGVPSMVFSTLSHGDYHKTSDTPEKIDYQNIERFVKAMAVFVIDAASNPREYPLRRN